MVDELPVLLPGELEFAFKYVEEVKRKNVVRLLFKMEKMYVACQCADGKVTILYCGPDMPNLDSDFTGFEAARRVFLRAVGAYVSQIPIFLHFRDLTGEVFDIGSGFDVDDAFLKSKTKLVLTAFYLTPTLSFYNFDFLVGVLMSLLQVS